MCNLAVCLCRGSGRALAYACALPVGVCGAVRAYGAVMRVYECATRGACLVRIYVCGMREGACAMRVRCVDERADLQISVTHAVVVHILYSSNYLSHYVTCVFL